MQDVQSYWDTFKNLHAFSFRSINVENIFVKCQQAPGALHDNNEDSVNDDCLFFWKRNTSS